MIGKRNTSAGLRCTFYHACLSSTTSNVFVTCYTHNLQNRFLRDNNCRPKEFPARNLNRARPFHIKRNRFCGRRLREIKRRRPAEVSLFPLLLISCREGPVLVWKRLYNNASQQKAVSSISVSLEKGKPSKAANNRQRDPW